MSKKKHPEYHPIKNPNLSDRNLLVLLLHQTFRLRTDIEIISQRLRQKRKLSDSADKRLVAFCEQEMLSALNEDILAFEMQSHDGGKN